MMPRRESEPDPRKPVDTLYQRPVSIPDEYAALKLRVQDAVHHANNFLGIIVGNASASHADTKEILKAATDCADVLRELVESTERK